MHLNGVAGDPQRHLIDGDLGRRGEQRVGKRVGGGAGAIEDAARRLDVAVHFGDLPAHALEIGYGSAEHAAVLGILHRLFERALGEPQRDRRVEAALGVEGREQFAKAVFEDKVLRRQFDILEADLVQIFAAHRVIGAGHRETRRPLLDQDAADALAARLFVDAGEDDEHAGLLGAADQGLDAVEPEPVADTVDIGLVIGDVGPGVRLGHADRQQAVAAAHRRQYALLDGFGRIGRNDAGLDTDLAEDGHRRHIAGLGDLLEDERGVEDRQAEPAILLRHRHAEDAQLRQWLHVVPREGAVHPARGALAELALRQLAHGRDKTALLVGQGREHGSSPGKREPEYGPSYGPSAMPLPLGVEEAADQRA